MDTRHVTGNKLNLTSIFQTDTKRIIPLSEYHNRAADKVVDKTNGEMPGVVVSRRSCRVCNVALETELLADHEVAHLERELVEHAKALADKAQSKFWVSGSLRCGLCGVASKAGSLEEKWLEIGRHLGRDHGVVGELLSKQGAAKNVDHWSTSNGSNKRSRSVSEHPESAKKAKVEADDDEVVRNVDNFVQST